MSSANVSLSAEQFFCSICMNVFSEPVTAPCGHNYCKSCINGFWTLSDLKKCPLCTETFHEAPELRVNTEFRDMLEIFRRTRAAAEDSGSACRPGEVPCDLCHGVKRKALKSCLVCLASFCDAHLEPHRTASALKWHKLIKPVEKLEERMCKKHHKMIEFFCKKDQSCICVVCLRDDHVMHEAVSLEEEFKERKTKLEFTKRQVKHSMTKKCIMVKKIETSMTQGRQEVERTKAETAKAFAALVALIEAKKVKLIELLEEKQKAAEQQAETLIRQLQLDIAESHQTNAELEKLLKAENEFRLLQNLPPVSSTANTKYRFRAGVQSFLRDETVTSAVAKVEETLAEQVENIIREVNQEEEDDEPTLSETEDVFDDELGNIQKQHATKVTLDPNTAHPSLILSEDRKQVRDGGTKTKVADNPSRFDCLHLVLGSEGFSSGCFYYEVTLKGQTGWEVGVARESISRKGVDFCLSPENGCWTLGLYRGRCQANENPPVVLSLSEVPQKVGVFVDYEGGLVSFYDVDNRALIYSFTGCAFTASATLLGKLFTLRTYTRTKSRIYPLFRPEAEKGSDSDPLQISPVRYTKEKNNDQVW